MEMPASIPYEPLDKDCDRQKNFEISPSLNGCEEFIDIEESDAILKNLKLCVQAKIWNNANL